jgi:hypothetical protein
VSLVLMSFYYGSDSNGVLHGDKNVVHLEGKFKFERINANEPYFYMRSTKWNKWYVYMTNTAIGRIQSCHAGHFLGRSVNDRWVGNWTWCASPCIKHNTTMVHNNVIPPFVMVSEIILIILKYKLSIASKIFDEAIQMVSFMVTKMSFI